MSSKPNLFTPFTLRGVTFKNRMGVPPMITCAAVDGIPQDFHVVHYGNMALKGFGLIIQESTAVCLKGRITPNDLTMIDEKCIPAYQRITKIIHEEGCKIGIQLSHSGRKGSQQPSQIGRNLTLSIENGGWELVAPSPIRHEPRDTPKELTIEEIKEIEDQFANSASIAVKCGYDFIEVHAAHGYLIHEFLSPISNHRKDEYGCDTYENRTRFLKEILVKVRKVIPENMPLFVRLSCVDYVDGGITLEDSIKLSKDIHESYGVDLIDCSSAGVSPNQNLLDMWSHQLPYAKAIHEAEISTAAVGGICDGKIANDLIVNDETDIVLVGRGYLRDAINPRNIAKDLELPVPDFHKTIQREVNRIPAHCKY